MGLKKQGGHWIIHIGGMLQKSMVIILGENYPKQKLDWIWVGFLNDHL